MSVLARNVLMYVCIPGPSMLEREKKNATLDAESHPSANAMIPSTGIRERCYYSSRSIEP